MHQPGRRVGEGFPGGKDVIRDGAGSPGERKAVLHREAPRVQFLSPSILCSPRGNAEPLYCVNGLTFPGHGLALAGSSCSY